MTREELCKLCVAVCSVPKHLQKENVAEFVKKKLPDNTIRDIGSVDGADADPKLTRWILLLSSENDVQLLVNEVKEEEIDEEGQQYKITYQKAMACELPLDWEERYKDLTAEAGGYDKLSHQPTPFQAHAFAGYLQGPPGFHQQFLQQPVRQVGPVSGFYENYPSPDKSDTTGSMPSSQNEQPPGQVPHQGYYRPYMVPRFPNPGWFPNQRPTRWPQSQNVAHMQGGFPLPQYPGALPMPPNSAFPQPGVSGGPHYPFPPRFIGMMYDHSSGQLVPVSGAGFSPTQPQHFQGQMGQRAKTEMDSGNRDDLPPPYDSSEYDNGKRTKGKDPSGPVIVAHAVEDQEEKMRKLNVSGRESPMNESEYKPEVSKEERKPEEMSAEKPTKIFVSNLPSSAHEDYIELFFENTRKFGGGSVFHVEFDEEERTAVVEFEEPEAVEMVLSKRPIKMMDQEIGVEIYVPEEPKPKCTIEVTGPPDIVCEEQLEMLEMYFENERRCGGGTVVDKSFDPESNKAFITFETEEIAMRVEERGNHMVNKKTLIVKLHTPETKQLTHKLKGIDKDLTPKEEPPTLTVKVKGVDKASSRDTLEFYFENYRRSGGGEIEAIKSDEEEDDVLYVTFKSPEAAKRVAEKNHSVENQSLKATLFVPPTPPPSYDDRIVIKGLKPSTTQDCLFNFIEAKTGFIPERMDYHAEQEGVVMVTFQLNDGNDLDFDKLEAVLGKNKLEEASLKSARVPISDCILVSNLAEEVTKDTVEYYFENTRKSGGGQVKKVVMNEDETCLVYFQDYTVIDRVLNQQHTLGNQQLDVKRYQECLGRPEGELAERKLRIPEPIFLKDVNSSVIKFMGNSKANQSGIEGQLEQCHAKIQWPQDKGPVMLECTITTSTPDCYRLVKTWSADAVQNFNDYIKLIVVHRVNILQDIWQKVMEELQSVKVVNPDAVALFVDKKEGIITVVGNTSFADPLATQIKDIAQKVLIEAEKEKQKVKEPVTHLKPIETRMLLADKFPTKMEASFPELKVKINQAKNEIMFEGMLSDVQAAKIQMYEFKNAFAFQTLESVSSTKASLYSLKQTKDYIVKKLKLNGVAAVWECTNDTLTVMSATAKQLGDSVNLIEKSVVENVINLLPASVPLITSEKWQGKVDELHAANTGVCYITVPANNSKIHIVTTDDISDGILENVKNFLHLNTEMEEKVHCSKNVHRLLERFHKDEISKISNELKSYHVKITPMESYGGFQISGVEKGIKEAKKKLSELFDRVKQREHVTEKPGLGEYMRTPKGKDGLNTIETSLHCVVATKNENEDEDTYLMETSSALGPDSRFRDNLGCKGVSFQSYCKAYDTRNIILVRGDMSELTVDAFVNPTDEKLSMSGGLSKALVDKGGKAVLDDCKGYIQSSGSLEERECYVSTAGNLHADIIIHVRGPVWKGGMKKEDESLAEVVFKCLMQASVRNLKSAALPAISCGVMGFPLKKGTQTIIQSVKNFFREMQESTLIDIYMCDKKQDTIDGFEEALGQEFGRQDIHPLQAQKDIDDDEQIQTYDSDEEESDSQYARGPPRLPDRGPNNESEVFVENIKIAVVKGEIAKQKVDVIVNTTAKNLDLKNGAVSLSLLKCGGQELQQEVSQKYPNGIKDGEIAVTSGKNLSCRIVVHTSLGNWDKQRTKDSKQELHKLMVNCLTEAEKQGLATVAFPAVGTGNLGYPKDVVAKEMFNGVSKFAENRSTSKVGEVRFIVYQKDLATIQAFEAELKLWASGKGRAGGGGKGRQTRKFNAYEDLQTGRQEYFKETTADHVYETVDGRASSDEYRIGSLKITVVQGDITTQNADCIVNSSNDCLDLSRGFVSKAIQAKGGQLLVNELQSLVPEMKKKGVVMSSAPGLNCKKIIHIEAKETKDEWNTIIKKCLVVAEQSKLCSIAFPALGTGMQLKASDIACVMTAAIMSFEKTAPKYLHDVRFVIFQESMVKDFHAALRSMLDKGKGLPRGDFGSHGRGAGMDMTKSSGRRKQPTDQNKVTFTIVALSEDTIKQAIKRLDSLVEREITEKKFNDSIIMKMDENQLMEIQAIAKLHHLEVKMKSKDGSINITGISANVMAASDKIHRIMRDAATVEQQKNSAALLSNLVQWFYIEITQTGQELVPYDNDLNYKIESAYTSQAANVKFAADKVKYVLDFQRMEEYEENDDTNSVQVIRRDLVKDGNFELPAAWGTMNGNLRVVPLQQTDQEYLDIAQKFTSSAGQGYSVTKIEKIQNKTLWTQYQTKKKQLDDQNPPNTTNEKCLWHGTAAEAVDNINFHGFNRSYCGKNATAYGDGVYFAVNASYSASDTYSRPDPTGTKKIYYSRVLTGEYTRGKQGLRVPPCKGAGSSTALYDSVVDNPNAPGMYIIFHDTQAYPEYLVSFKRTG